MSLVVRARRKLADFELEIAFEVPAGVTILFGPSGAGKSTTLAIIAGLLRPDQGTVRLGADVWFDAEAGVDVPVHRRGVAMVFQSLALFPHMTALGNVEYGIDRKLSRAARRRRALEMLERMNVTRLADRKPVTFSGGEAQRVALARAFAMSPRLILLDEPFSALDRQLRRDLGNDVRATVDELAIPAIVITHRGSDARAIGERMVLLRHGRVEASGPPEVVLAQHRGTEPDDPADSRRIRRSG
jgi:molybdate transport system ATP-binding protein